MFKLIIRKIVIALCCILTTQSFHAFAVPPSSLKAPAHKVSSELDPRIVGGQPISITQAPWQVSVRLKEYEILGWGYGHICGGSVISTRVVISAAHCVANTGVTPVVYRTAGEYTLVMGSVDLYVPKALTLQFSVLQVTVNPYFNYNTLENDAALFFMNGAIPVGFPTVTPIALNSITEPSGAICSISGWGTTSPNGQVSSVLLGATVPIVSTQVCDTNYGNISAGMLCAGYMQNGGVDACQGDSGGPLVCNNYLAGIVSWGYKCGRAGYPGVYTNVSYYKSWITYTNASYDYYYFRNNGNESHYSVKFLSAIFALWITMFWR